MHLCYLDESGTSQIPGNTSHYVLAGIEMPATHWKLCDNAIKKIKRKYKLEKAEIHTAWLLRSYLEQKKIPKFDSLDYSKRRLAVNKFRKKSHIFSDILGVVWNYLEIFDLDGHNLGTVGHNYGLDSFLMIL